MDKKNLQAGKKVAQELAPDPVEHTPEAPIISLEEAQRIESPDGNTPPLAPEETPPDDIRRDAGQDDQVGDGLRITPEDDDT
jgi:hypothetical protein